MITLQQPLKAFCLFMCMIAITAILTGCNNYLVFSTATKFGIDASQEGNQPPKVVLGYKRAEVAIIPAKHRAATETEDIYAVLGNFCVMANPSLYDWVDAVFKSKSKRPRTTPKTASKLDRYLPPVWRLEKRQAMKRFEHILPKPL